MTHVKSRRRDFYPCLQTINPKRLFANELSYKIEWIGRIGTFFNQGTNTFTKAFKNQGMTQSVEGSHVRTRVNGKVARDVLNQWRVRFRDSVFSFRCNEFPLLFQGSKKIRPKGEGNWQPNIKCIFTKRSTFHYRNNRSLVSSKIHGLARNIKMYNVKIIFDNSEESIGKPRKTFVLNIIETKWGKL